MLTLELSTDQNQSFSSVIENDDYRIAIYQAGLSMLCDITRNQIPLVIGGKIASGMFMLPYFSQFYGHGNFMLLTKNYELADFNKFGDTQTLLYFTIAEMLLTLKGLPIT